jgi:hypothetical protein
MKLEKERIRHRALLRVHPFAPAQSQASLASVTAHLIRPTHSTLGVGFGSAVLTGTLSVSIAKKSTT